MRGLVDQARCWRSIMAASKKQLTLGDSLSWLLHPRGAITRLHGRARIASHKWFCIVFLRTIRERESSYDMYIPYIWKYRENTFTHSCEHNQTGLKVLSFKTWFEYAPNFLSPKPGQPPVIQETQKPNGAESLVIYQDLTQVGPEFFEQGQATFGGLALCSKNY